MFVECVDNNGSKYLRLVQSVRAKNKKGMTTCQKKVIYNIGPLSRFDDGLPDYVDRLKKSYKAGSPLIPALLPYCEEARPHNTYHAIIQEGSPDCFSDPKLFCHVLFERIMEELGLNTFFAAYKRFSKIQYDVYGFTKLMVFGRVLQPASKCATVKQNDKYYEPVLKDFNPDNVYDTLTFISDNSDKIIRRINTNLVKKAGRNPEVMYYDVTNFFFEIPEPDEDIFDEDGNVIYTGQRKFGVCKQERHLPIVQMGLFMDDDGIPVAIKTFPGNTLDHLTLRPAMQETIDTMDFARYVMIADRGIFQYRNLLHLLDTGHGYIVSKSLLKSAAKEREWAYKDDDFIFKGTDFKYKSRIVSRNVDDENGVKRKIEEKVVVYWSKRYEDRARYENKSFLDFLKKLEENPGNFRITAVESKTLRKFIKKEYKNVKTGETVNASDLKASIDFDKVEEFTKGLGYYQIVTSELTLPAEKVIEKYHGLTQIEDQFRVMKSDLDTRPIYVRTPEHINAHLLICLIALIIIRIIQNRIKELDGNAPTDGHWYTGMSAATIQEALNQWKVDKFADNLYKFAGPKDPDLAKILKAFGIDIPLKIYTKRELKAIKTSIKVFK